MSSDDLHAYRDAFIKFYSYGGLDFRKILTKGKMSPELYHLLGKFTFGTFIPYQINNYLTSTLMEELPIKAIYVKSLRNLFNRCRARLLEIETGATLANMGIELVLDDVETSLNYVGISNFVDLPSDQKLIFRSLLAGINPYGARLKENYEIEALYRIFESYPGAGLFTNPANVEITFDINSELSDSQIQQNIKEYVLLLNKMHHEMGGKGLKIDSIKILEEVKDLVPA